jgi:predicted GNAT family acetyltransferase
LYVAAIGRRGFFLSGNLIYHKRKTDRIAPNCSLREGTLRKYLNPKTFNINMDIEHIDNGKKGIFKATENGSLGGRMTYVWAGSAKIIIDHTEVEPAFSGKGVGRKLLSAAVEMARGKHIKILPLCPYAKSVFDKDKSLEDVLF